MAGYRTISSYAIVIFVILAVYVLSIGPVLWLTFHDSGPPIWVIEIAYAPLGMAKKHSPVMARWIDGYISLWVTVFGVGDFENIPLEAPPNGTDR